MIPHIVRPLEPWIGPATPYDARRESPFSATWTDTLVLLNRELVHLGAPRHKPWVLQMDVPESQIRNDGGIYARATPRSPAIRVCFDSRHGPLMYAADRFTKWQANVRAVALGLEALRKVDRYGIGSSGEQYRGYQAIGSRPALMTREQAAEFIAHWSGVEGMTGRHLLVTVGRSEAVQAAWRMAAKRAHPDVTRDDGDTMSRLNAARDLLTKGHF